MTNDNLPIADAGEATACPDRLLKAAAGILKSDIGRLQMISAAAVKLLQLSHDENIPAEDLIRIIETEPALAAKVLNVVNSAAYSLPNTVQSIKHALSLLGFSAVRQIATEQLLYKQLINPDSKQRFDQLFLWQHCLFVANLSKQIALDLAYPQPDVVYTGGLLHDIGKMVLESHGKVSYSDFLASCDKSDSPADHHERAFFGLSHTEMAQVFCVKWHLPAVITAAAAFHHDPAQLETPYAQYAREAAIISFADYIAWLHGIGSSHGLAGPVLPEDVLAYIDIDKLDFESLLLRVDEEMTRTAHFYGIEFPHLQKIRASLVYAALKISRNTSANPAFITHAHCRLSSLTSPHRSLEPQHIVLATLEAMHNDFGFDRVIMFGMSRNRHGLSARYSWPRLDGQELLIPIDAVGGQLLQCLRKRTPVIINQSSDGFGRHLLQLLEVDSFIAVPVLRHNRLVGVLYADYQLSKKPVGADCLLEMLPIANELGVALLNAKQYKMTKRQAEMDALSQLFNKGKIIELLTDAYRQKPDMLHGFAIGFVDIDHFKKFNDICGHQAGDDALKIVAGILRSMSRPDDFVGRYGGEEFLFVLHNTNPKGAFGFAERMRLEIEKRGHLLSGRFHNLALTASIGVAMYKPGFLSYPEHVQAADKAMYQAKNQGRNRVVMMD